ncbi:BON domain-containing protein [Halopseudomonas salegens]|uniref:Osmotically-inducible protein OsmY, contains BON domain n=1 Tax=Halopseudomonas salegens TaxID=1434072 RepID=A0A1H2GTD9_9GAMM|nr:BON domain-containing protein [Halopseudomonas salegens]SDU22568.1 Osmotically-inducible protein OsmY, contains BON domain [Halopseudomonas salegens]
MKALTALLLGLTLISGCSTFLTATRDGPIEDNQGTRTLGSVVDDGLIETKVTVNVNKAHPDMQSEARIQVTSFNGIVLIVGQVPSADMKPLAEQAAANVQRVKVVHNELTVGERLSILARNQDSLITTNAKTRMLADSNVPGRRIKVTTEAGIVYLLGLVTRAEADLAVESVKQVAGVQRIVKLFEYID